MEKYHIEKFASGVVFSLMLTNTGIDLVKHPNPLPNSLSESNIVLHASSGSSVLGYSSGSTSVSVGVVMVPSWFLVDQMQPTKIIGGNGYSYSEFPINKVIK